MYPKKRRMLLNELRHSHADVAFIQETHFKNNKLPLLQNKIYLLTYHSPNPKNKSRGVSILISNKLPWKYQDSIKDPMGRFIFLRGSIGEPKVMATIYAPNERQDAFLRVTLEKLSEFSEGQLILGGDFNIPLIPSEDTSSSSSSIQSGHLKRPTDSIIKAQLINVWRLQHSGERDYTFYSPPHKIYTRIDYFLVPHDQLQAVKDTSIGHITWSDHAPILLTYRLSEIPSFIARFWRLNESLLQTPEV